MARCDSTFALLRKMDVNLVFIVGGRATGGETPRDTTRPLKLPLWEDLSTFWPPLTTFLRSFTGPFSTTSKLAPHLTPMVLLTLFSWSTSASIYHLYMSPDGNAHPLTSPTSTSPVQTLLTIPWAPSLIRSSNLWVLNYSTIENRTTREQPWLQSRGRRPRK